MGDGAEKTILIVENDDRIARELVESLEGKGYRALRALTGSDALRIAFERPVDLTLLDVTLPGALDGYAVCSQLRSNLETSRMPIALLSDRSGVDDTVRGFQVGADDYITKPFSVKALTARVDALLRRAGARIDEQILRSGALELNLAKRQARLRSEPIDLTFTEYAILEALMKGNGRVLTRRQIASSARGAPVAAPDRAVDVHISCLRAKLGDYRSRIKTARGVGYRFDV